MVNQKLRGVIFYQNKKTEREQKPSNTHQGKGKSNSLFFAYDFWSQDQHVTRILYSKK